jgi:uncharacterized membrane protein YeiB
MASSAETLRGPVRTDQRALAPDLARGFMLLMIVLANTPWYLYGQTGGLAAIHPVDGSGLDRFVQLLIMTLIDFRVYPMFAFLFGYGMVQMFSRQVESGIPVKQARRLLRRRNWWLLAFGFVHAALLWNGDVLGAYGLAGLVVVGLFFKRRSRTLIIWGCVLTGLLTLSMLSAIVGSVFAARGPANEPVASFLANAADIAGMENYLESIVARLSFWPFLVIIQGLGTLVIPTMLLFAFWAARQRILEQPGSHLSLLRRVAVVGLAVGWSGGLVHALEHLDLLAVPDQVFWVFFATQSVTGLFAGLGYVALFALIAHRIAVRRATRNPGVVAVTAVGKRSLSCYLAQSLICAPALSAWGFGLGGVLGSAGAALFAVGVWLLTLVLAYAQERAGQRGPAEVLLRRLVYRRPSRSAAVEAGRP